MSISYIARNRHHVLSPSSIFSPRSVSDSHLSERLHTKGCLAIVGDRLESELEPMLQLYLVLALLAAAQLMARRAR